MTGKELKFIASVRLFQAIVPVLLLEVTLNQNLQPNLKLVSVVLKDLEGVISIAEKRGCDLTPFLKYKNLIYKIKYEILEKT